MLRPALTPISPSVGSTWISANAGSGKTRALVERVVTLLLLGVVPERICCITYTKAAAGEMRARILGALRELLVMDDDACRARVQALTGHEDITLARSLFARVLDSPFGGLQLTTIHGFCQQLLRRFPLESGLSPQFSVLEDTEAENLQRLARQRLLEAAEQGGELAQALALVAERGGEHAFNDLMRQATVRGGWWEGLQENYPLPAQLRAALLAQHGLDADAGYAATRAHGCATLVLASEEACLRAALPHFSGKDAAFGALFAAWLDGSTERDALLDALYPLFFTKADEQRKKPFTKDVPAPELMARIAERHARMVDTLRAVSCAEESYAAALVSMQYVAHYQRLKTEYQALDYDDLIRRTEGLLAAHGGWVMSRLDHRIDHLLVDEAQDTSPGQWRIVRTLVEELIVTSGGIGSGNVPRSLLVVGDEKQAIFGFQGADPKQFAREADGFFALLGESASPLATQALENSYRSAQAILTLVDAVAALPPVARALSAAGTPGRHIMKRADHPVGRVVLHPPLAVPKKEAPAAFTLPTAYEITESAAQQLAHRMADDIAQWIDAGTYHAGEILILLWRRQPFADCLIRVLEQRQIPVAGIDRLRLSEHLAVRDLMALMQWCGYAGDDLALAQVLRSPIIGVSEAWLEDMAHARVGSLWQRVQEDAGVASQLAALRDARHRTPYDFLTHVLEVQGARLRYAARFGEEVHEVLDELKAQAAAMPKQLAASIDAFADWITRSEREVKRQQESGGHAVRIMTVHGSKGLEAPVVLLVNPTKNPDTARETSLRGPDGLPVQAFSDEGRNAYRYRAAKDAVKQDLFDEYYRLLYVALTRPRDALHLYALEPVREGSWYQLVAEAMEALPTHETDDGALLLQDAGTESSRSAVVAAVPAPLPAWARQTPAAAPLRPRVLSPSRLVEQATPAAMGGKAGANVRGVRMHRVLQFLTPQSDLTHIARLAQLAAPDWSTDERDAAIAEIAALHAAEPWLWASPAHAEVSIGGMVDGQLYSGQIDRLVFTPEEVVVVDYKTGSHIPATAQQAPEAYRLQMKIYQALLQPLYPQKKIRCALLWTSAPQLMWMDEALAATALPNLNKI